MFYGICFTPFWDQALWDFHDDALSPSLCLSLTECVRQREERKAAHRLISLKQHSIYSQDKGRSSFSREMKKLVSNQLQLDKNQ